jgi:hypothetical protein
MVVLTANTPRFLIAQVPQAVIGQWTLQLGKRTLFVLALEPSNGQPGPIMGSLSRPTHFATADAVTFSNVEGPTEVDRIVASHWEGDTLSFTTQNPKDASDKTVYKLTLKDKDDVQVKIEGVPLPPLTLVRSQESASVSDDWHSGQRYFPDDDASSNPEMKRIFDEDQRARQAWPNIDWPTVNKADAVRRVATMRLLNEGALHSGEDFEWAANVFQHGSDPDDFLLAHTLAIVAVRKGYSDGTWIAAATLDRYLQAIKQPQIYGTQFLNPDDKPTTQEPYNRTLIPDTIRRLLQVPDRAAQELQLRKYDSQRHVGGSTLPQ